MNKKIFIVFLISLTSFAIMQFVAKGKAYEVFFDITLSSSLAVIFLIFIEKFKPFDKEVRKKI